MNKFATLAALAAALILPAAAQAQIVVNGTAEGAYGSALTVQDTPTGFGDSTAGTATPTDGGSELDGAYGVVQSGTLYIVLAGNLEGNYNKLDVFIDSTSGGQNSLLNNNPNTSDLQRLSADPTVTGGVGLTFDSGFAPDYYISANGGGTPYTFYVNFATLPTAGGGTAAYLGSTTSTGPTSNGTLTGGDAGAPQILAAIDNSNAAGVSGTAATGAGAVKTGVEFAIPLSAIGNPTGPITVCAFINGSNGDFLSNQVLGGLGGFNSNANLGDPRLVNFANIPGSQFFTVPNGSQSGPTITSLKLNPSTVAGSLNSIGKVTLSAAPTSATTVTLTNTNPKATLPASGTVTVAAGATTATFTIHTTAVSATTTGNITATLGSSSQTAKLTVRKISVLNVKVLPTSVKGGTSSTGTVTLEAKAAPSAITVTLASGTPSVASVPASVVVPAGQTKATFTITTHTVTASTVVKIKATAAGLSKSANLTVTP